VVGMLVGDVQPGERLAQRPRVLDDLRRVGQPILGVDRDQLIRSSIRCVLTARPSSGEV
jgi:hypothetical protein